MLTNIKKSLIVITVDCLRADHCGFYGYLRPTTPFLDSLAKESFVVPHAIVAGAPTYYSVPSILASRMPLALGRDVGGVAPGEKTLSTVLRDAGYTTAAFSAANPYISQRFGYDQGFNLFRDFLDFENETSNEAAVRDLSGDGSARGTLNRSLRRFSNSLGLGGFYNELYFRYRMKIAPPVESMHALRRYPSADILVDHAESWLASVGVRPFFLWLHVMDPHSPYYPPEEAFRELTGASIDPAHARYVNEYWNRSDLRAGGLRRKKDEAVQLYDAGIRWMDRQIARLVDGLKVTNRWNECVLAVTADHGEEFLEHGGRYHAPVQLSEEIIRVPLLLRVPGQRPDKLPASPMSHLHLAPTLLDILDVKAPPEFRGRSLWANLRSGMAWDDPAVIECEYGGTNPFRLKNADAPRLIGVRDARFKMVIRIQPQAVEELYDLEADPAEVRPLASGMNMEARRRLLSAARDHIQSTLLKRDPLMRVRSRLRDLQSGVINSAVSQDRP